jgi:hypothetical protein
MSDTILNTAECNLERRPEYYVMNGDSRVAQLGGDYRQKPRTEDPVQN